MQPWKGTANGRGHVLRHVAAPLLLELKPPLPLQMEHPPGCHVAHRYELREAWRERVRGMVGARVRVATENTWTMPPRAPKGLPWDIMELHGALPRRQRMAHLLTS